MTEKIEELLSGLTKDERVEVEHLILNNLPLYIGAVKKNQEFFKKFRESAEKYGHLAFRFKEPVWEQIKIYMSTKPIGDKIAKTINDKILNPTDPEGNPMPWNTHYLKFDGLKMLAMYIYSQADDQAKALISVMTNPENILQYKIPEQAESTT